MVNFTFVLYHHCGHGSKIHSTQNKIDPEKDLIQCVGKVLIPLTVRVIGLHSFEEVYHLSEHLFILI